MIGLSVLAALHVPKHLLPCRQQMIRWCPLEITGRADGLKGLHFIVIIHNKSPVAVKKKNVFMF